MQSHWSFTCFLSNRWGKIVQASNITEKLVSCQQMSSKTIVHFEAFSFWCALIYLLHLTRGFTWQCALICWGEGDVWWGTCKGDALPMGWTRLLRLSVICIRSVHVIRVHMWRIPYALETNVHCVVGRDDGSVCLLISTSHCYYPMGEAFKFRHHDQDTMAHFCVRR